MTRKFVSIKLYIFMYFVGVNFNLLQLSLLKVTVSSCCISVKNVSSLLLNLASSIFTNIDRPGNFSVPFLRQALGLDIRCFREKDDKNVVDKIPFSKA